LSDKSDKNINKDNKKTNEKNIDKEKISESIKIKAAELAEKTGAELRGNPQLIVDSARGIDESRAGSVTFADKEEYFKAAVNSDASLVVSRSDFNIETDKTLLITDNPRRVYAQIADILTRKPYYSGIISDEAVISDSAELADNLSVHAGVVIAEGAEIAEGTILAPGVIIGPDVEIGRNCLF